VVIDSLFGLRRSASALLVAIEHGERILIPSLVVYDWLRGPRLPSEIAAQEALFPSDSAIVFGHREALLAAALYGSLKRPRGREIDIAIAACTLVRDAGLWTLNMPDFRVIPQLRLAAF
jgi:predicted nucleic acid-binding protein